MQNANALTTLLNKARNQTPDLKKERVSSGCDDHQDVNRSTEAHFFLF